VSVGEVLHVYKTPEEDLPVAPAGEQNAPGETVGSWEVVGVGVGVALAVGVTLGVGVGVALAVGVTLGVGTT
jgi:hypothetical protein